MKVKATIIEEGRHPGDIRTLDVLEFPRVPTKDDFVIIKEQRYKVIRVDFIDNGDVVLKVERRGD